MNPHRLEVSIDEQTLTHYRDEVPVKTYVISTAAKGMGTTPGSNRTPTGNFRIAEKIGDDYPSGTIFKSRVPIGQWEACGHEIETGDLILSRILWLDGVDEENSNTFERYIYIHGTPREDLLGQPASHGCIRMANADIIELFNIIPIGTPMTIHPQQHQRGKLLFLDCDSTLSSIEGIDELARAKGPEVYAGIVELTDAAMNGELPIHEVFPRRMEIIRPDGEVAEAVARQYISTMVPGSREFIRKMKDEGWLPVILSGGFAPLIEPLARELGIEYVEAVPLHFNEDGSYGGYDTDYPTTRNLGKNEVIREWKAALNPERVVMIGDGVSDLETLPEVDRFIAFFAVTRRDKVAKVAEFSAENWEQVGKILS
ncbi:MAG: HAD-IB family phosphatase [Luteolibacter sp.]